MIDSTWGRSLATQPPAGSVGDETIPQAAQQPPGLIPGILSVYPGCTPKPRNLSEYKAACRAALGKPVAEYEACRIVPGMKVYYGGRFLVAVMTDRLDPHADVELRLAGDGLYVVRVIPVTAPVYCLAPAPDACHAPGAGTSAHESTAAAT